MVVTKNLKVFSYLCRSLTSHSNTILNTVSLSLPPIRYSDLDLLLQCLSHEGRDVTKIASGSQPHVYSEAEIFSPMILFTTFKFVMCATEHILRGHNLDCYKYLLRKGSQFDSR
jgi:hypothetical protein